MAGPMRALAIACVATLALIAIGVVLFAWRYGGGERFPDLTTDPELPASALEVVADLDSPPGNIAVSASGRILFSFHPEASPPVQVAELVNGTPQPYPPGGIGDGLDYQSVLAVRIDRQNRFWVLDNANHGSGTPRLLAFDLNTDARVHRFDFPREIAGLGSHLNDFQVSADGNRIYIADASIFAKTPALIVYDVATRSARRLLEGHRSVAPEYFVPHVQGQRMVIFGIFAIRPGVDSIALDRRGEWLYFAAVTSRTMYRVRRADLDDAALSPAALAKRVEAHAPKTMSDGITTDLMDNIYLSDPDESAIVLLTADGRLRTLLKDAKLRWPDGFSFGPNGWLYVTCSALHHVIMRSADHIRDRAPYQIFRFRPGFEGIPGQ
ncbi:MAG: L-dopachrome tautomerase-related protein [Myxococcota bacterium]